MVLIGVVWYLRYQTLVARSSFSNFLMQGANWKEHEVLQRWSSVKLAQFPQCKNSEVTKIHIYDFDQTLFVSPLPNPVLYPPSTINHLRYPNSLANGGWFMNSDILEYSVLCRKGKDSGKWNLTVAELVSMSIADENTLCILLTGRSEAQFTRVIEEAMKQFQEDFELSRGFDAVCLKKEQMTTASYKTSLIVSLLDFYSNVNQISIYDDRERHCKMFREFLKNYAETVRPALIPSVVIVPAIFYYLPSDVEIELVHNMVADSNKIVQSINERKKHQKHQKKKSFNKSGVSNGNFNIFHLHNSAMHSSYALDVETTIRLQEKAIHFLKSFEDLDADAIPESLDWFLYPYIPISLHESVAKVSVNDIAELLHEDGNVRDANSLASNIQKGHQYHQRSWQIKDFVYVAHGNVIGFRVEPADTVSEVPASSYYTYLLLAGPKSISFYTSQEMHNLRNAFHHYFVIDSKDQEVFTTYLGVYHNFRLKSAR